MPYKFWRNLLAPSDAPEPLVPLKVIDEVISLFVDYKIDSQKFGGNLKALLDGDRLSFDSTFAANYRNLHSTPSIYHFTSFIDRPSRAPLWTLCAFPDVMHWVNEQVKKSIHETKSHEDVDKLLCELYGFDESEEQFPVDDESDGSHDMPIKYFRNLVKNYIRNTGTSLETAVEEGSMNDMYMALDMLGSMGQESNFTLIATMATKYYSELKMNYSSYFPNETTLLAMTGILDANMSIFGTKQISLEQVIELARTSNLNNSSS